MAKATSKLKKTKFHYTFRLMEQKKPFRIRDRVTKRLLNFFFPGEDVNVNTDGTFRSLITALAELQQQINEAGTGNYTKPPGGIPYIDLAESVRNTLDDVDNKVNIVEGKGLSSNDYTNEDRQKLASLSNYNDAELRQQLTRLQTALDNLMNGESVTDAIDTFAEIVDFLNEIDTDDPTLANQLLALNNAITALQNTLSTKANSADVVPNYRTINGKALNSNVTIGMSDIQGLVEAINNAGIGAVSVTTNQDGTFTIHVGETDYAINLNHTHEGMVTTDVCDIDELPEPEDMDENTIYAGAEDDEISVVYIGGLPFYGGGGGSTATPVLRRPVDGDSLAMGLPNNGAIESAINIKGKSLSQSLLVEITGTGFTFGATQPNGVTINQQAETPTATIDAAVANSALGVNVVIAYTGNTMYAEGLLSITGENGISADVSLMSVFTPTMSGIVGQWEGSDSPSGGSWIDRVNNMAFTLGGTANKTSEGYRLNNLSAQKAAYAMMTAAATTLLNQQIDKVFTCYVETLVKFSAEGKNAQIIDFGAFGSSLSGISLNATIYRNGGYVGATFKNDGNKTTGFASSVTSASTGKTFELDTYVPLRIKLGVRLLQNGTQELYVECGEGRCYAILNTPRTINFSGSNAGNTHPETRVAAVLGLGYTQDQYVDQLAPNSFADVIYKRILIFNTEV